MPENQSGDKGQESFGEWFLRAWTTYPLRLLGINFMFLIFCIPVLTIPAALCALHGVVQRYYRERYASTDLQVFLAEFRDAFLPRTLLCFGVFAAVVLPMLLLRGLLSEPVWTVAAAILVSLGVTVLSWFLSQVVYLNLKPAQAMKNSLILLCLETKRNFALLALHGIELTLLVFGLPLTGFALLFLPVLHVIIATGITMPALQERLAHDS